MLSFILWYLAGLLGVYLLFSDEWREISIGDIFILLFFSFFGGAILFYGLLGRFMDFIEDRQTSISNFLSYQPFKKEGKPDKRAGRVC
jgi:hypothetical protein